MRSLPRPSATLAAVLPALAAAQDASDPSGAGRSPWNWVIGIAALVVVIVLGLEILGPTRRVRPPPRRP